MKVIEQIERFGEERGGITFADLLEYSMDHNRSLFRVIAGRVGSIRVLELIRRKGWDDSVTEDDVDDVDDAIADLAQHRGEKEANRIAYEIYSSRSD